MALIETSVIPPYFDSIVSKKMEFKTMNCKKMMAVSTIVLGGFLGAAAATNAVAADSWFVVGQTVEAEGSPYMFKVLAEWSCRAGAQSDSMALRDAAAAPGIHVIPAKAYEAQVNAGLIFGCTGPTCAARPVRTCH